MFKSSRVATRLLYVAIIASVWSILSDILLLYTPQGNYLTSELLFYKQISFERTLFGHLLGVFFIPIQLFGLVRVFQSVHAENKTMLWSMIILSIYMTFPGVAYHATCALTAMLIKQAPYSTSLVDKLNILQVPLGAAFILGICILSIFLIKEIYAQRTDYPRWMIWCTPITWVVFCLFLYRCFPLLGNVLVVASFNFSFFCFFSISAWIFYKQEKRQPS